MWILTALLLAEQPYGPLEHFRQNKYWKDLPGLILMQILHTEFLKNNKLRGKSRYRCYQLQIAENNGSFKILLRSSVIAPA